MRRSGLGWVLAMVVVAAGCGGDEAAAPVSTPTTALPTTTSVVSTTTAAPTTTSAPTTTTEPPTTTMPPPTTMVEVPGQGLMPATVIAPTDEPVDEATKAAILEAHRLYRANWKICVAAPDQCDLDTIARPGGLKHELTRQFMRRLARNGYRGRAGTVAERDVVLDWVMNTNGSIDVTICGVDSGVIFDPAGTDDPSDDRVIDDRVISVTTMWNYVFDDGRWRLDSNLVVNEADGDQCPH